MIAARCMLLLPMLLLPCESFGVVASAVTHSRPLMVRRRPPPPPAMAMSLRGGASSPASASKLVASALGWTMSAAALAVYTPIIGSMVRSRRADGMSAATWSLQLAGFLVFCTYHIRMGYALSTFLDFAALGVQSTIILALTSVYQRRVSPMVALPAGTFALALLTPRDALQRLQLSASVTLTLALLPQIVKNIRTRSGGGWSPVSAAMTTFGNVARVFTTFQLADSNPLLLFQFGAGAALNGLLLAQTLLWGTSQDDD